MALTPTLPGLWVGRVICGFGIGPLTVVGTMSIAEIAPTEIRGLLSVWFSVLMCVSSVCAVFTVLGSFMHIAVGRLQYQVVWFAPCVFFAIMIAASFFVVCESPRWLWLKGRHQEAIDTLLKLRGLPADHPRVEFEINEIKEAIEQETKHYANSSRLMGNLKEMFTVKANLRRLQQTMMCYALAQISGANSITSYFIPILTLLGQAGGTEHSLFLSGMYSMSKLFFTLIACFFMVDALGRRGSLFAGATLQMLSDIYLAVYLKYEQVGPVSSSASQGAIAFLFIHALGYAIGLFILPYVFGGELWPNQIRSLGGAISQCFHCKVLIFLILRQASLIHYRVIFLRHELCASFSVNIDSELGSFPFLCCLLFACNVLRVLHGA